MTVRLPFSLRRLALLLSGLFLGLDAVTFAAPQPIEVKLADGIFYAQSLKPTVAIASPDAEVIDLRGVAAEPDSTTETTSAASPFRIILLSSANAADWLKILPPAQPNTITLAPADSSAATDLTIEVPTDVVAQCVQVLASGADPIERAFPPVTKRRFDEASLVERRNGHAEASPAPLPTPTDEVSPDSESAPTSASPDQPVKPPADLMLQRAVQVIAGLRALKKI